MCNARKTKTWEDCSRADPLKMWRLFIRCLARPSPEKRVREKAGEEDRYIWIIKAPFMPWEDERLRLFFLLYYFYPVGTWKTWKGDGSQLVPLGEDTCRPVHPESFQSWRCYSTATFVAKFCSYFYPNYKFHRNVWKKFAIYTELKNFSSANKYWKESIINRTRN